MIVSRKMLLKSKSVPTCCIEENKKLRSKGVPSPSLWSSSGLKDDEMQYPNNTLNWEYVGSIHSTQILSHAHTFCNIVIRGSFTDPTQRLGNVLSACGGGDKKRRVVRDKTDDHLIHQITSSASLIRTLYNSMRSITLNEIIQIPHVTNIYSWISDRFKKRLYLFTDYCISTLFLIIQQCCLCRAGDYLDFISLFLSSSLCILPHPPTLCLIWGALWLWDRPRVHFSSL